MRRTRTGWMGLHRQLLAITLSLCACALQGTAGQWRPPTYPLPARAYHAFANGKAAAAAILTKANPSYITIKPGSYIATNCTALAELGALFTSQHADSTLKAVPKYIINLPCKDGSVKVGASTFNWDTPNYSCVDPATNASIQAVFMTTNKVGSVTISAMVKGGGCVLPGGTAPVSRPKLTGGAPTDEYGNEEQFLVFGSNDTNNINLKTPLLLTAIITGLEIDGAGVRPGVGAYYAKALIVKSTDIVNTYSRYQGAALDAVDTTVTWTGNVKKKDRIQNCTSVGYEDSISFNYPGAGGAITIRQETALAPLTMSNIYLYSNSHSNYGGVFYVWKLNNLGTKVTFKGAEFDKNSAGNLAPRSKGGCSVGVTFRQDGFISYDSPVGPVNVFGKPLLMSFTALYGDNTGQFGPVKGVYLCGAYADLIIDGQTNSEVKMPFDALKGKTGVKATGLTAVDAANLPPTWINNTKVEYAFVKSL